MRKIIPALALGLILGAVSCAGGSKPPETVPATPTAPPGSTSALANSSWLLEELSGRQTADRVEATLAFDARDGVSGNGSCNQFHGTATISGTSIAFGPLVTTRMACVPAVGQQEGAYLEALHQAERFEIEEPFLTIYLRDGAKPLKFIRAAQP